MYTYNIHWYQKCGPSCHWCLERCFPEYFITLWTMLSHKFKKEKWSWNFAFILWILEEYYMNILKIFYQPVDDAKLQIKKRRNKSFMYFMNISRIFYEYCWIFYGYFITQRTMLSHKLEKGEKILGSLHFVGTFSWGETTSLAPLILFLWIFSLTSFVSNTYNSFHGFWVSWMTKN